MKKNRRNKFSAHSKLKTHAYRNILSHFEKLFYRQFHYISSLPWVVVVELTNHCNARCIMCDRKSMTRKMGMMDWVLYRNIIDQIAEYGIRRIHLNRFGEPLLHPKLAEMIQYAKKKGIKEVSFVTNGMLLNEDLAVKIIDAGLDKITVSIDGASSEVFDKTRVGCKLSTVSENLMRLLELRERKGMKKPFVQINSIIMEETLQELPRIVEKWKQHVDFISINGIIQYGNLKTKSLEQLKVIERKPQACPELFWKMVIFWNGDVGVCCEDVNGKLAYGNVQQNTIKELWKNERITWIRQQNFKKDFSQLPLCSVCDLSDENKLGYIRDQIKIYRKKLQL